MTTAKKTLKELFSPEEIKALVRPSDLRGAWEVLTTWAMIAGSFALVAWWPHLWTVLVALVVLGGRQLALSVLMHEASHRSLFRSRWLNETVGTWLCAAPVWTHLKKYRKHHKAHHNFTQTDKDTDLGLVEPFPTSRASMFRKFARDLFGISGLRRLVALVLMDFGFLSYTASVDAKRLPQAGRSLLDVLRTGAKNTAPVVLSNAAIFGGLALVGKPALYLLWIGAYLTTFSLFLRIRSIAEHACTTHTTDTFLNTRTTYANPLARLTVAPHFVNYHLEHHLLRSVPCYRLRRFRALLQERGALDGSVYANGYLQVLRQVSSP